MKFLRTHRRLTVACLTVVLPLATLVVARPIAQARLAATMTDTATRFASLLSPKQRARLSFEFQTLERFNWHYIPRMRKGLALRELTADQRKAALDLLRTGLSASGYETAQQIMSLERILIDREKNGSMPMVRDPENYYFVLFGTPSAKQPWGWRVEGHHISVNFTIAGGRVDDDLVANTPLFFGAEPAEVQGGPRKGLRVLGGTEDKAKALMDALDAEQRTVAIIATRLPTDIFSGNDRAPDLGSMSTRSGWIANRRR